MLVVQQADFKKITSEFEVTILMIAGEGTSIICVISDLHTDTLPKSPKR